MQNQDDNRPTDNPPAYRVMLMAASVLLVGLFMLSLYAGGQAVKNGDICSALAASYLTAGAAFVVGSFIGCLFGLPQGAPQKAETSESGFLFLPSNQLQLVSDWLVKILLGASLTQLEDVADIGEYFGEFVGSSRAATVIIAYFFISGLLVGYLIMSLRLARLISDAGQDLVGENRRITIEYSLYQSLYKDASAQRKAIRGAEAYLQEGGVETADMLGQLACAYAQAYRRQVRTVPATAPEARLLLDKALEYANKAVDLDSEWGSVFVDLYEGDDQYENDFVVFTREGNDPDGKVAAFIRLLNRIEEEEDVDDNVSRTGDGDEASST